MSGTIVFLAVENIPEIMPEADLATIIAEKLNAQGEKLRDDDVLVIAQKVVSKAEGRFVDLASIQPSHRAIQLAEIAQKDARLVEVILSESTEVVRIKPGVIIVAHRNGYVMANAGIDQSNLGHGREGQVLLLPLDPDRSAATIRRDILARFKVAPGVVISDSFGRAWRNGVVNIALGAAGIPSLVDERGFQDRDGRVLAVTQVAFADAVAAGAALVMGEGAQGTPAVVVRGLQPGTPHSTASALIRPKEEDMFR